MVTFVCRCITVSLYISSLTEGQVPLPPHHIAQQPRSTDVQRPTSSCLSLLIETMIMADVNRNFPPMGAPYPPYGPPPGFRGPPPPGGPMPYPPPGGPGAPPFMGRGPPPGVAPMPLGPRGGGPPGTVAPPGPPGPPGPGAGPGPAGPPPATTSTPASPPSTRERDEE
eukprot:TRINITY_DN60258_c0_g1_i2.p2 TRINITY_DN60258_c0_g1~~TRINITY_DN60258_c0_g1_i2.p2  ORF type:complete len:168 (+),score=11.54 TRINITY_DN60258_c0_g1_i2:276-779(+)